MGRWPGTIYIFFSLQCFFTVILFLLWPEQCNVTTWHYTNLGRWSGFFFFYTSIAYNCYNHCSKVIFFFRIAYIHPVCTAVIGHNYHIVQQYTMNGYKKKANHCAQLSCDLLQWSRGTGSGRVHKFVIHCLVETVGDRSCCIVVWSWEDIIGHPPKIVVLPLGLHSIIGWAGRG